MQIDAENIVLIGSKTPPGLPGQVLTRNKIGDYVWQYPSYEPPQTYGRHAHPFHYIDKVDEFHQKFKVEPGNMELRRALILEELKELHEDVLADNRRGIIDGLCDVVYVVAGTQLAQGIGLHYNVWVPSSTKDTVAPRLAMLLQHTETSNNVPHAQGLAELIHICHHIADAYNIDLWTNFMLVHENNMNKTWSQEQVNALPADCAYGITPTDDGRYIIKSPAGKVLKPPGHVAPELVM